MYFFHCLIPKGNQCNNFFSRKNLENSVSSPEISWMGYTGNQNSNIVLFPVCGVPALHLMAAPLQEILAAGARCCSACTVGGGLDIWGVASESAFIKMPSGNPRGFPAGKRRTWGGAGFGRIARSIIGLATPPDAKGSLAAGGLTRVGPNATPAAEPRDKRKIGGNMLELFF